jgi:hypothetical protein
MHVVAAERMARLVVGAIELCEECAVPLSERQKIALLTVALLESDGVREEVAGLERVERLLAELGGTNGHGAA